MSALASPALVNTDFANDVLAGLARQGQKQLPPRWLYDDLGSALFDAITLLPEYGLTRAEARLLQTCSPSVAAALPGDFAIVELGSGSGSKTRSILEAFAGRRPVDYFPVDVSAAALKYCVAVLESIPGVRVVELNADYLDGLERAAAARTAGRQLLVLFLGSTIGNFDALSARTFLRQVRDRLLPGDALLLGTDLVKPLPQLLQAYDDPIGVTAAFNLNVLSRINRELDGDFDIRAFAHEARFNQHESRIEMHLRSLRAQSVNVKAIDRQLNFTAGETIWTEGSYKFRRGEILDLARATGFETRAQWVDHDWPFAESLMLVQ